MELKQKKKSQKRDSFWLTVKVLSKQKTRLENGGD
jgi:hypothetical protein